MDEVHKPSDPEYQNLLGRTDQKREKKNRYSASGHRTISLRVNLSVTTPNKTTKLVIPVQQFA
jgi:hypothetical protein